MKGRIHRRELTPQALLAAVLLAAPVFFALAFSALYRDVARQTIRDLNVSQLAHARQAAQGIQGYVFYVEDLLTAYAALPEIADLNDTGRRLLTEYLNLHPDEVRGVTRVDATGRIIFTIPDQRAIGRDISGQEHVRRLLATRRTVISDVFTAVQGFRTIAVHVPVFRGGTFDGSLAFLLSFDRISRRFIESIRIGANGYAWMISAEGFEISCPVPGHVGRSAFETNRGFPELLAMVEEMLKGREGTATYLFDRIRGQREERVRKHAVYLPIRLGGTFWSIVVATPEDEIMASLAGFRAKLVWLFLILLVLCVACTFLLVRFRVILREGKKREAIRGALSESEQKYRKLIETTGTGFVIIDASGLVVDANDEYVRLSGHRRLEEIRGRSVVDWTAPSERERNREAVARCFETGAVRNLEVDYRDARGRDIPVEINATVVELGKARCILSLCRDISDRRAAETERKRLQDQLVQAQRLESIGRLAGGVAHDFNNMLSVILGHVEIALAKTASADPVHDDLAEIDKAARLSENLTRQLLGFARRQPIEPRILDLNQAVAGALQMLRRLIGENIGIDWQPAGELWPVMFDPAQLDHILANLAVNARDAIGCGASAAPGTGRISIATANLTLTEADCGAHPDMAPGAYARLSFGDTGCGIPAPVLEHMFEPFFTTKQSDQGTGLGLAMVYGAVRQNRGFITVHSREGAGTRFDIHLPRHDGEVPPAAEPPPADLPTGSESVLLVEDEPMVLALNRTMLEMLGYRVHSAPSPAEALQLVETLPEPPLLLITDMVMPEMNGLELARKLLSRHPGLRCLLVSGYAEEAIDRSAGMAAPVHFLAKPFSLNELAVKVREVLETKPPAG